MDYINFSDVLAAKLSCVSIIANLKYMCANITGVECEKTLDVVTVNRKTSVEAPHTADG